MPNTQDLRRRVRAVKSTQQITKAMKMVAAARLRRAQERVTQARPYTIKMMEVLGDLSRRASDFKHPLLGGDARDDAAGKERVLLLLVTADKGLCGAFNTNLIKAAQEFLRQNADKHVELAIVGRKGCDFFRRRPVQIAREFIGVTGSGRVEFAAAQKIAQQMIADFTAEAGSFDRVMLIYNEFKSALSQRPVTEQMLPVGTGAITERQSESLVDYVYEQPAAEIFDALLPKLIETQIFRALLESIASEMGAKMTAMDSASKNADEVIDRLTLTLNRVRQAAITREIIEVVSGAESL